MGALNCLTHLSGQSGSSEKPLCFLLLLLQYSGSVLIFPVVCAKQEQFSSWGGNKIIFTSNEYSKEGQKSGLSLWEREDLVVQYLSVKF